MAVPSTQPWPGICLGKPFGPGGGTRPGRLNILHGEHYMSQWTQEKLYEAVQQYGGVRPAAREIGVPESTIRRRLKDYEPPLPPHAFVPDEDDLPATHIGEEGVNTWNYRHDHVVQRFILTSAQNNADVHRGFLHNLEALANELSATMLVSFTIYDRQGYRGAVRKGDTNIGKHHIWWDRAIQRYAFNARARLHKRLAFCGELDILATAKNPLAGLESYCGRSSIIVPHNRFAFQCVASRKHHMPKEMFTTGSVTRRRFIQRKAGQVAHFHHVLGALLVEVTADGCWHVHHLNAEEGGSFYWLDRRVEDGQVKKNEDGIAAVVLGDVHHEKLDEHKADVATDMLRELRPREIVVHDLIDFRSRNHHNIKDPLFRVRVQTISVEDELKAAARWLVRLKQETGASLTVVKSNHDQALERWIRETDWRDDPINAEFYLECAKLMVIYARSGSRFNPLEWAINSSRGRADPPALFLDLDESYEIEGIEVGIHGHIGPNGAKGSPRAFSKLGFKTFTAHTHTPSIVDGCYTVGVLGSLDLEYNHGPSNWMYAHGIIYPNGKRAFIFTKNHQWRA